MHRADTRTDVDQPGTLRAVSADGVDQLLGGGRETAPPPLGEVLCGTKAVVAKECELLVTAEPGGPTGWHEPIVRCASSTRSAHRHRPRYIFLPKGGQKCLSERAGHGYRSTCDVRTNHRTRPVRATERRPVSKPAGRAIRLPPARGAPPSGPQLLRRRASGHGPDQPRICSPARPGVASRV